MANLVIVALPREDDYVNTISSEKKAHCTLLFLGELSPKVTDIALFLQHAVSMWDKGPFMLDVDYRGTLGADQADVLFFKQSWSLRQLEQFRGQLLKDNSIRTAYDSTEQFDGPWLPHLTLGYPHAPAREDKRDYPGINWVEFDRIALWYGDFDGPEFRLEYNDNYAEVSMDTMERGEDFIKHFGVKGMKWGQRRKSGTATPIATKSTTDKIGLGVTGRPQRLTKLKSTGGHARQATSDAVVAEQHKQVLKKSGMHALSNNDLKVLNQRLQLEVQVKQLTVQNRSSAKKLVNQQLKTAGQTKINKGVAKQLTKKAAKVGAVAA